MTSCEGPNETFYKAPIAEIFINQPSHFQPQCPGGSARLERTAVTHSICEKIPSGHVFKSRPGRFFLISKKSISSSRIPLLPITRGVPSPHSSLHNIYVHSPNENHNALAN